jgi:hypothetical protein
LFSAVENPIAIKSHDNPSAAEGFDPISLEVDGLFPVLLAGTPELNRHWQEGSSDQVERTLY